MAKKYSESNIPDSDLDIFSMIILVKGPNGELGGFIPRFFLNSITERCMCCHGIPRSPFRAPCGHSVCHSCLHNLILISHNPSCFSCDSSIQKENCFPDIPLSGHLKMCDIRCPYVSNCQWVGRVEQLKNHFNRCVGVNHLFRSWMESVQICLSNLQDRSHDLESRVDNLEMGIKRHKDICQQRYIEQDNRSKYLTQQLKHLREQSQIQPKGTDRDRQVEDDILRSRMLLEVLAAITLDVQEEENNREPPADAPPPERSLIPLQLPHPPQPMADEIPNEWTCVHCSVHNPKMSKICSVCFKTHDNP